jgi:hypothetical protein
MQEIVISVMAAVARRFIHDRHADLYLGSKRDDFGWCETTPQYLRCNFNYDALGIKANSGWRYCHEETMLARDKCVMRCHIFLSRTRGDGGQDLLVGIQ